MALALVKTFKSAIVDTIQSLPQHQQVLMSSITRLIYPSMTFAISWLMCLLTRLACQIVLCSIVKLCNGKKKDTTIGEVKNCYRVLILTSKLLEIF